MQGQPQWLPFEAGRYRTCLYKIPLEEYMNTGKYCVGALMVIFLFSAALLADEPPAQVAGKWLITIQYIAGEGHHTAVIEQKDGDLGGVYKGEFKEGTLRGSVKGNTVDFTGWLKHEANGLSFHYTGAIDGDTMKGTVDMGEYWTATFTAKHEKR